MHSPTYKHAWTPGARQHICRVGKCLARASLAISTSAQSALSPNHTSLFTKQISACSVMWASKYKTEMSFSGIGTVSLSALWLLHLIPQICCNQSGFTHRLGGDERQGGVASFAALCVLRHCIKVAWSLLGKGFAITHVSPSHIMFMDMIDWTLKLPFAQMITQFLQAYCVPLIVLSFNNEVEISQDSLEIPSFSFISLFFSSFFGGAFLLHTLFSSFLWARSIYQEVLREIRN